MTQRKTLITNNNIHTVKSPLAGMVYLSAIPHKAPFVQVGQKVKAGDTLCLIETMKMFTEFKADRDGVITELHVDNAKEIDAGDPLFKIQQEQLKDSATLTALIDHHASRENLNQGEKDLLSKLKDLKKYLAINSVPTSFDVCVDKLLTAVTSAFNRHENINAHIFELDEVWTQYWNATSTRYHRDVILKGIMTGLFVALGVAALAVIGAFFAPAIISAGLATIAIDSFLFGIATVGMIASGAYIGSKIADFSFFNNSKNNLDAAVKLSGKINEIRDDIGMITFTAK